MPWSNRVKTFLKYLLSIGALAILASFDLQATTPVAQLFTFGAPRVGDTTFEQKFQSIRSAGGTRSRFAQVDTTAGGPGK
jgi:predicted lipase